MRSPPRATTSPDAIEPGGTTNPDPPSTWTLPAPPLVARTKATAAQTTATAPIANTRGAPLVPDVTTTFPGRSEPDDTSSPSSAGLSRTRQGVDARGSIGTLHGGQVPDSAFRGSDHGIANVPARPGALSDPAGTLEGPYRWPLSCDLSGHGHHVTWTDQMRSHSTQRVPSHQRCQTLPSRPGAKTSIRSALHDDAAGSPVSSP